MPESVRNDAIKNENVKPGEQRGRTLTLKKVKMKQKTGNKENVNASVVVNETMAGSRCSSRT